MKSKKSLTINAMKLLVAQVGPKKGKKEAMAMVLATKEIPGDGWRLTSLRSFRSKAFDSADETSQDSERPREISVWGFFQNSSTSQNILIKINPFATTERAQKKVDTFVDRILVRLQEVDAASEIRVRNDLKGSPTKYASGIEYAIQTGAAKGRRFKDICFIEGQVVVTVSCSVLKSEWSWDEILKLSELQRMKIFTFQHP